MTEHTTFKLSLTKDGGTVLNLWKIAVLSDYPDSATAFVRVANKHDLTFIVEDLKRMAGYSTSTSIDDEVAKELLMALGQDW